MSMDKEKDTPADEAAKQGARRLRDERVRLGLEDQHRFRMATEQRGRGLERMWRKMHPDPACWAALRAASRRPLETAPVDELLEDPFAIPLDAEVATYEFGWWPFDWPRKAIRAALKDWPVWLLRALAKFATQLAHEREAA